MRLITVLFIALLFLYSCADDDSSNDQTADQSGDSPLVVSDDPIVNNDPTGDSDPIVTPEDNILRSINLTGITVLALKPRIIQINNYRSQSIYKSYSQAPEICEEMGSIEGDQYTELITEGATPCFSDVEIWKNGHVYGKYRVQDQSSDTTYSFVTDASGDVHHLPGHPKKKNSFKGSKRVDTHNGKPVYINYQNKLVSFDASTDTEMPLVNEGITNYSIKSYDDGYHFIIDASTGVKRIKPDKSEEIIPEITKGSWHDIGDSVQYVTGGYFKRMIFDSSGDIIDRVGYSNPEAMWLFINDYPAFLELGLGGGLPKGISFSGSLSDCSDNMISSQRVMVCNGKAYKVKDATQDLQEVIWIDYGHPAFDSWETVKLCTTELYLYFYSQSILNGDRLTRINNLTDEFQDILNTHKLTDLECISDSELVIIGTIGELTETLSIAEANTVSPLISVIDSQITDIITP